MTDNITLKRYTDQVSTWPLLSAQEEFELAALSRAEETTFLKNRTRQAINRLSYRERVVIEKRVLAEDRIPLREIGEELNLSKERVRQVEHEALSHLEQSLDEAGSLPS